MPEITTASVVGHALHSPTFAEIFKYMCSEYVPLVEGSSEIISFAKRIDGIINPHYVSSLVLTSLSFFHRYIVHDVHGDLTHFE